MWVNFGKCASLSIFLLSLTCVCLSLITEDAQNDAHALRFVDLLMTNLKNVPGEKNAYPAAVGCNAACMPLTAVWSETSLPEVFP